MQSVQLQSLETDYPQPERSFYMRLSEGVIDNFFCYVGKAFSGAIVLFGLMCLLNKPIQEAKREDNAKRSNPTGNWFESSTHRFLTNKAHGRNRRLFLNKLIQIYGKF